MTERDCVIRERGVITMGKISRGSCTFLDVKGNLKTKFFGNHSSVVSVPA